jgi:4-amino-4-deoxy-L-arabinose transferase-like glycosyltransferase
MTSSDSDVGTAWKLDWLTPRRCRWILVAVLVAGFLLHLVYLGWNSPIDLSGDEAQYWDWSRSPDLAYYSKGPLIAYINWLSTGIFGDSMLVVRLPALLLAIATTVCAYWITKKLFDSERLGLGVVLLMHTAPLFVAGSMLMTIDPPYFFCWALATCFAAKAIFDRRPWFWIGVGIAIGVGLLAKYAAPLWFVGLFAFLVWDRRHRPLLRTPGPYAGLFVALLFFIPPLIWNWRHDWVTFKHVGRQIGVTASERSWIQNVPELIGTQIGIVGPVLGVMMIVAIVAAARSRDDRLRFLLAIGLSFFAMCFYRAFKVQIEPNWPAPMFFTLMPVVAWWLGTRLQTRQLWKPVRGFFWAQVVFGVVACVLIHRSDLMYPLAQRMNIKPGRIDSQVIKMRGNAEFGQAVGDALATLPPGSMVMGRYYYDAAILSFYVEGQPRAMAFGSFLTGSDRTRRSQYDLWPDRDLSDRKWIGRDAVIFGALDEAGVIRGAFESIERRPDVVIERHGVELRRRPIHIGRGFRGLSRPIETSY